jgi:hypothetical protein
MTKRVTNPSAVREGQVLRSIPTPPKIRLATIEDCRREMARVYRSARTAKTDTAEASRLVYMLTSIAKLIEIGQLEQRLITLEEKHHGIT